MASLLLFHSIGVSEARCPVHRSLSSPCYPITSHVETKDPSPVTCDPFTRAEFIIPSLFVLHNALLIPYIYIIYHIALLGGKSAADTDLFLSVLSQQPFQLLIPGFQFSHLLHDALQFLRRAELAHTFQLRYEIVHLGIGATRGIATTLL